MDAFDTTVAVAAVTMPSPRALVCHYNPGMVAAAWVVSLLGAFTSTQLMSQARGARTLSGVLIWTILGSLVFGFCAVWCLHFLAMLSCEFDVPIGLDPLFTILSAVCAVVFTFGALSTEHVRKHWRRRLRQRRGLGKGYRSAANGNHSGSDLEFRHSSEPLLSFHELSASRPGDYVVNNTANMPALQADHCQNVSSSADTLVADDVVVHAASKHIEGVRMNEERSHSGILPLHRSDYDEDASDDSSSMPDSQQRLSLGTHGLQSDESHNSCCVPVSNTFVSASFAILRGLTLVNIGKGFVWSIAITSMHFMGVEALNIPGGFVELSPARVILCGTISWSVCCMGVILMAGMEVNIKQQALFTFVAATGVAAVHFSGMYACSFWSTEAPSSKRSYPIALPVVIASAAILSCMVSTGLLAHSATTARDKLAEVLYTKKRLWAAIAQKENAEAAAAARSEFIASASHEIRTPLHQLQGYADLLSKSELSEEDRLLLRAIQHATRSLSMITSNVLDWSRLERGESVCRPVAVDIRIACEAIIHLLPNRDDNMEVELIVVVAPDVPPTIFVDETYLQRILMNLLSNAFKFTTSGYVMLLVGHKEGVLHVSVKDSGSGIPRSFLPQLFEPYKQVQARGAERGTGLGLSITRRLLERMQGSIIVESKYSQDQGVGPANSGSQFILTIPVAVLEQSPDLPSASNAAGMRVAIMHDGRNRDIEGLTAAWKCYGASVLDMRAITDVPDESGIILWADLCFLQKHSDALVNIFGQQQHQHLVLVPYHDKAQLVKLLGPTPSGNIIPVRKPLIWHRIVQTVIEARQLRNDLGLARNVKSPPIILSHNSVDGSMMEIPAGKKETVLLVEDNKVNQKLGAKMLKMLGYDVLLAEDGQEAIDVLMEHTHTIDAILMDQSMPRKDGITATREIREMEASGHLDKRQTIIAVTAAAGPEAQAQFVEAGTDMFLSKPLSLAKLEQTLSHYFNR